LDAARRGLRVIVARPSNILGPGLPPSSALGSFARQIREIELGQRAPVLNVGDLSTSRDFIDVRDVAHSYVALATHRDFSGVVNVAAGEHVVMRWVLEQLIAEFGIPVSVAVDASRLRAAEVQKFSASALRLRAALGEHRFIPLSQTLRDIVAHERAQTG
jgi:GDP-4-dehydro-6-deoxy-D-mannose reductase